MRLHLCKMYIFLVTLQRWRAKSIVYGLCVNAVRGLTCLPCAVAEFSVLLSRHCFRVWTYM